jgi:carbonic anhydrase
VTSAIDDLAASALAHEAEFEGQRAVIPSKHVTLVTCMDSRIDTFRIFGLDSGEAHILRNAGGLITEDTLRSLVLSQRLLQTREVFLMQHTDCGLHDADEDALRAQIAAETGRSARFTTSTNPCARASGASARIRFSRIATRCAVSSTRSKPGTCARSSLKGAARCAGF